MVLQSIERYKKFSNAKGRLWVSNPVCGALVVVILPLGQLEPLDVLCVQNRVLVHKRVGALLGASSVTVGFFWGDPGSRR